MQSMHELSPGITVYLPAAQSMHALTWSLPVASTYFPAMQPMHFVPPLAVSLYRPAAQSSQLVAPKQEAIGQTFFRTLTVRHLSTERERYFSLKSRWMMANDFLGSLQKFEGTRRLVRVD
jgi:hypothetical protein